VLHDGVVKPNSDRAKPTRPRPENTASLKKIHKKGAEGTKKKSGEPPTPNPPLEETDRKDSYCKCCTIAKEERNKKKKFKINGKKRGLGVTKVSDGEKKKQVSRYLSSQGPDKR